MNSKLIIDAQRDDTYSSPPLPSPLSDSNIFFPFESKDTKKGMKQMEYESLELSRRSLLITPVLFAKYVFLKNYYSYDILPFYPMLPCLRNSGS